MPPRYTFTLLLVATLSGCGAAELPPPPAALAAGAKPLTQEPQLLDDADFRQAENPVSPTISDEASVVTESQPSEFEPPYPTRENLFLAPKRNATHTKAPGSSEQTVELLGFANVAEPKVILSINGVVVPIAEGGQESGIEVISIQPPAVVLQRDRERWQATLEN